MNWLQRLTTVDHPDPHVRRRGTLLAIILLALIGMLLLLVPIGLASPNPLASLGSTLASVVLEMVTLWLVRRGRVSEAGWFFIITSLASTTGTIAVGQIVGPLLPLFFLILPMVTAGVILPPRHIWAVLVACLITCAIGLALRPGAVNDLTMLVTASCAAIILVGTAVISYLSAHAIQRALDAAEVSARDARQARQVAEEQARVLAIHAETLQLAEQRLQNLVATLETPTVALADGVLLAPLIGSLDTRRTQELMQRLLQDVSTKRVGILVLDVAGVALIDTDVAGALTSIVQSVRLLGCQVIITGVAPTVALTLAHLGVDLAEMQTARSPQEVLGALGGSLIPRVQR